MTEPGAEYAARLDAWRGRMASLDRSHLLVSNARLVVAAAALVLLWMTFVRESIAGLWPAAAAIAFIALVVVHARVLQAADRARRAERWYLRGTDRLKGDWIGRGRDGARFLDDHSYARDLDLFGRGSLFELLNTANTEAGEETLAGWLCAGAPMDEVLARQPAVAELAANVAFREELAVLAGETEVSRTGRMAAWAQAPAAGLGITAGAVFGGCALVTIVVAVLTFSERIGAHWLLPWLMAEAAIALIGHRRVRAVLSGISTPERDLSLVQELMARIERESFNAPRLSSITAALKTGGVLPSRRIAQLRRLVSWLDSTRNQIFAPFALALLVPQLLAVAVDRWHAAYGPAIVEWLRAIGELEALSALGTYTFEHPGDPFPAIVERGPLFEAVALGHPLMLEGAAVRNDVALAAAHGENADAVPQVIVISGSNMSGKSTLLRSVGVNVVLALAGAPVRAGRLRLSPLVIGATLRVEDSLQAGHSRFYAEILRIRAIVDAARGPVPLLFLLDEILHGTNSFDRRIGAEAIVRALVRLGAIGLVTTHDLALTELPERLGKAINMHFEDRLEDGRMVFDYRMRPGVVEHSNALALMRAVGLDV